MLAVPSFKVVVEPVAFERGSTLVVITVDGVDHSCYIGPYSRLDANDKARELHRDLVRQAYDAEDARRRLLGRPKVSRVA